MPETDGAALALIPSLAVPCDKLEELETLEKQIQVRKQPRLLQEAEPAEQGGTSHEHSFWMAWPHIARWREQEVDALKAAMKQATFCHWRKRTALSRNHGAAIFCNICEMWLNGRPQYEEHKLRTKHRKNNRNRRAATSSTSSTIASSSASWVDDDETWVDDDETWSTTCEIGWSTTSEIGSGTDLVRPPPFNSFQSLIYGPVTSRERCPWTAEPAKKGKGS